jgi:hypothetical protein
LIGTLGYVCDKYEKKRATTYLHQNLDNSDTTYSVAEEIINDRRFEQVLECLVCGIDVKYRLKESLELSAINSRESNVTDVKHLLSIEDVRYDRGLSIRDCCRAAWGVVTLGLHKVESMGGEKILDLLLALALRSRELLLARLQLLQNGDLFEGIQVPSVNQASVDDRIKELSEEMAEDAATAMWTFAYVQKCTGITNSRPLFEVCESILSQDPFDLRRKAQNVDENIETNDIVERLATTVSPGMIDALKASGDYTNRDILTQRMTARHRTETLFNYLSFQERKEVLWAQNIHWKNYIAWSIDKGSLERDSILSS